jgi:hypothetical protein
MHPRGFSIRWAICSVVLSVLSLTFVVNSDIMPPTYPVKSIGGLSYRCDNSTAPPLLWLEVVWEEVDADGVHTVTFEPHEDVQNLPMVAAYLSSAKVMKDVVRLRATAMKRHNKNTKDASRIAAYVVHLLYYHDPSLTHTLPFSLLLFISTTPVNCLLVLYRTDVFRLICRALYPGFSVPLPRTRR